MMLCLLRSRATPDEDLQVLQVKCVDSAFVVLGMQAALFVVGFQDKGATAALKGALKSCCEAESTADMWGANAAPAAPAAPAFSFGASSTAPGK
jgi:hypothetical protein